MTAKILCIVICGTVAGELSLSETGVLSFRYDATYDGTPLSLSMPVSNRAYSQKIILPYLEGLLPDDEGVRRAIASRYDVGPNNAFALLSHIGLDCSGGVQLCTQKALPEVLARTGSYEPLSDNQIAERLSELSTPEDSWVGASEHWSLGGNQGKFALGWHGGRWCSCEGSAPTTHIFKNGVQGFRLQALDEFFCMRLARACSVPSAEVEYREFEGVPAIIVKRFDRVALPDGTVRRLHQEDLCQALSVHPSQKYTADGGPDASRVLGLLASTPQATDNIRLFTAILFFNCLIGAPDAHAKNYSIILRGTNHALLAPLYDVASGLPYESLSRKGRLAMGIGGENRFGRMSRAALERYARNGRLERAGVDAEWCKELMLNLAGRIERNVGPLFDELADVPYMNELRTRLEQPLLKNCRMIAAMLA